MTEVTATKISEIAPINEAVRKIVIETGEVDTGNTLKIDMKEYSCSTFLAVLGFSHTTTDSVVVQEQPTTSVTNGVITLTIGGTTNNGKKRVYEVLMR